MSKEARKVMFIVLSSIYCKNDVPIHVRRPANSVTGWGHLSLKLSSPFIDSCNNLAWRQHYTAPGTPSFCTEQHMSLCSAMCCTLDFHMPDAFPCRIEYLISLLSS